MNAPRCLIGLATSILLGSGCSLFSFGSASKASPETPATAGADGGDDPTHAKKTGEDEEAIDFSGLTEGAAHPALARYKQSIDWAISAEREEIAPMWGIDIGKTAHTKTDPIAIYLYAAGRSVENGARLAEHCGAERLAEKLRAVEPFDSPQDAATTAASLPGWSEAGQSEAEASPGHDLEDYRAKRCILTTMERVEKTLKAAAELDPETPHHRGRAVVHAWAETLAVAKMEGSPWPVPEQVIAELAAFAHFVRNGSATKVKPVQVKPVHPGLVLYMEDVAGVVDAASHCELLGRDISDTARGSNTQSFVYASNVAVRTFPDLLETCDAKDAAELARTRSPKALRRADEVDAVFDALAPIFDDDESPERFCVSKASYVLRETLSETNRAASYDRAGINQTLPYAQTAFARFPDLIEQAEDTPEGRHALAAALLDDTTAQLRKWKRRPTKDLRRYED